MICERCHGEGFLEVEGSPINAYEVCPECNGMGLAYCCEGEQAEPEAEP